MVYRASKHVCKKGYSAVSVYLCKDGVCGAMFIYSCNDDVYGVASRTCLDKDGGYRNICAMHAASRGCKIG